MNPFPAEPAASIFYFANESDCAATEGIRFRQAPPVKQPVPVLTRTEPWESLFSAYGSIVNDEGLLRCYYTMWWLNPEPPYERLHTAIAYAESKDGRHWEKPALNRVAAINNGNNNLLYYGGIFDQPNVLKLPQTTAEGYRYAMVYYGNNDTGGWAIRLCYSTDALNWNWPGQIVWQTPSDLRCGAVDFYVGDDTCSVMYDAELQKYFLFRKVMQDFDLVYNESLHASWLPDKTGVQRMIAMAESDDLVHWQNHHIILKPHAGSLHLELHKLAAVKIPGGYLGLLEVFDATPGEKTISLEMMFSATPGGWKREIAQPEPWLRGNDEQGWDAGMKYANTGFLQKINNEWLLFYGAIGTRLGHDEALIKCQTYGMGVCTVEPTAFFGAKAQNGWLLTRPLTIKNTVSLQVEMEVGGELGIQLCNESGEPLAGFSLPAVNYNGPGVHTFMCTEPENGWPAGNCHIKLRIKNATIFSLSVN